MWVSDKNWTDTYWCQVNNEEEFKNAMRSLFGKRKIQNYYLGDTWDTEECLFNEDYEEWHQYMGTDEYNEDVETLTHPHEYIGKFENMPDEDEYPIMMVFSSLYSKQLAWNTIV